MNPSAIRLAAAFDPADRAALDDGLCRMLARRCGEAEVRRAMETPEGYDRGLFAQLAALGIVGLVIPERFKGSGGSALELEGVMERIGAALMPGPFLASGVLAARLLVSFDEAASGRWLPAIASGKSVATVAITGPRGSWDARDVCVHADARDRLTGVASYVLHAGLADALFVVAWRGAALALFEVAPASAGVALLPMESFDRTLRLAEIRFADAPAKRLDTAGDAWASVEEALAWARVALAGEQAGAARHVLEMTVDYAKSRRQFGRPIGAFQAIKHMAADLFLEVESAISAARAAARALVSEGPGAPAIDLAAFVCAEAFVGIAASAIQMHGGIAFTWDHPAHLYLRRARADAYLFGGPDSHRERWLAKLAATP